jgi:hypothetical protein
VPAEHRLADAQKSVLGHRVVRVCDRQLVRVGKHGHGFLDAGTSLTA